jgi:hypothetical protein
MTSKLMMSEFSKPDTGTMKKYTDSEGKTVVETEELSFLTDHAHRYGWLRRHYKHFRLRRALKKAKAIIAADPQVAFGIRHYYFIPKDRITVRQIQ